MRNQYVDKEWIVTYLAKSESGNAHERKKQSQFLIFRRMFVHGQIR